MKYRVIWLPRHYQMFHAVDFLAFETGRQDYRGADALRKLIAALSTNPHDAGESRENRERIVFEGRFSALFEVFEEQGIVLIYHVHYSH